MKVTAFLLINLLLILANIVGAGVLLAAYAVLGDDAGIIPWLLAAMVAIGCTLIFWRGAIDLLQRFAATHKGKPP